MSNSLLQQSLDLLDDENGGKQGKIRKRRDKGILNLIPVNHRLTSKRNKSKEEIIKLPNRVTIYEAKRRLEAKSDPTEENIRKLLLLGTNRDDSINAEKLLDRAVRKHYIVEENQEKKSTVFTEEDFKKFEAEYLNE